jgi:transposase-like protein
MPTRKTYNGAFKARVALEMLKGQRTANEIGAAYGIHPVQAAQCVSAHARCQRSAQDRCHWIRGCVTTGSDLGDSGRTADRNRERRLVCGGPSAWRRDDAESNWTWRRREP